MIKPPGDYLFEWLGVKIKEGITAPIIDYIAVFPILIGVSLGVYALCNMISSKLANLGVIGVFVYGALVVVAI